MCALASPATVIRRCIDVDRDDLVLSADTALTMLRSRVLVALENVAGDRTTDLFELADERIPPDPSPRDTERAMSQENVEIVPRKVDILL